MFEVLIGVASFFGGAFLTAVSFIASQSSNITAMKKDISQLKTDVKEIKERPSVICFEHARIEHRVTKLESKVGLEG